MVCLAQTVHLSWTDTNTVSKWTKIRFHMTHVTLEFHLVCPKWFLSMCYVRHKMCTYLASRVALSPNELNQATTWARHLGVPSGASKMISEPMVRSAQTMHLSCVKIRTIFQMNWIKHPLDPHQLGVPSNASKKIYVPTVCLAQTVHLSWTDTITVSKWTKTRFHMTHVTLEFHRVHQQQFLSVAQTVHLSCTDTNTFTKWTKMRFHMTHVTIEFHRVCPKWFQRLLYVWHKPCTYLASRFALSPNGMNRASTWASSPRSTIGCI
jgi:hypothetical protein